LSLTQTVLEALLKEDSEIEERQVVSMMFMEKQMLILVEKQSNGKATI